MLYPHFHKLIIPINAMNISYAISKMNMCNKIFH